MSDYRKTPCPKCGRKGLHYADDRRWFGWKDYEHLECRFCNARFKLAEVKWVDPLTSGDTTKVEVSK